MNKIDFFYGSIISFLSTVLGICLFVFLFTNYELAYLIQVLASQGYLGKLLRLGAVLNFGIFFFLLHRKKELMARGVAFATIILTIISLFI